MRPNINSAFCCINSCLFPLIINKKINILTHFALLYSTLLLLSPHSALMIIEQLRLKFTKHNINTDTPDLVLLNTNHYKVPQGYCIENTQSPTPSKDFFWYADDMQRWYAALTDMICIHTMSANAKRADMFAQGFCFVASINLFNVAVKEIRNNRRLQRGSRVPSHVKGVAWPIFAQSVMVEVIRGCAFWWCCVRFIC